MSRDDRFLEGAYASRGFCFLCYARVIFVASFAFWSFRVTEQFVFVTMALCCSFLCCFFSLCLLFIYFLFCVLCAPVKHLVTL